MQAKKFLIFVFSFFVFIVGGVGVVNYVIDPLWTFSHSNNFNSLQKGLDERQQKTNYITYRNLEKYDGILLGSSRTTFINENDFIDMNIYNYASSSMLPYEYKGYIDYFREKINKPLRYIIIGSDFFGTDTPDFQQIKFQKPEFYIKKSNEHFYRLKSLLSIDALNYSLTNIKNSFFGAKDYYDRNNIKYQQKVSENERLHQYTKNLVRHTDELSGEKYIWNNDYRKIHETIKKENPISEFIIFTSPVTADLLVSIIKNGKRWKEYEKWLRELVAIFGEVHHFMAINSITKNLNNYPDDDHYYPHVAKLLANKISGVVNSNIPKDFGVLVTKKTSTHTSKASATK
ncbi:hypothetical protein [Sulfurimonas xiamenensis]|uniref:Uncharacterized protein n=1 Tax=Sulfurimonas xiamenensis TaxID=2590021 RepID=A0AAJ4A222_9BACT|nr:hypothetical protein [Sulfurimonas xiamenensis]QFR42449.1 hypothetical protein FJR47_00355 [Sulfurimonas xiamenensis]